MAGHATSQQHRTGPLTSPPLVPCSFLSQGLAGICASNLPCTHFEAHPVQQAVQDLEGGEGGVAAQTRGKPRWVAPRCKAVSSAHHQMGCSQAPRVPRHAQQAQRTCHGMLELTAKASRNVVGVVGFILLFSRTIRANRPPTE